MITLDTKISADGQRLYYTVNYIKDGSPISIGKRLEVPVNTHPLIVTKSFYKWIQEMETRLQFEELCLKNSHFGTL